MAKTTKKTDKSCNTESAEFAALQRANDLDTLEVEGCKLERLKKIRTECKNVSKVLLAKHLNDKVENDSLFDAHRKIKRCTLQGAFLNVSDTVNYNIGRALCKSRLCPNCQRVLSAKRKYNFIEWFEVNKTVLAKFHGFYHMVLTMKHRADENIRTDVYTEELLDKFKKLRGGCGYRDNYKYWNKRVAGGVYSVEVTPSRDGTLHIHLHILVMSKMPLWRKIRRVAALSKNAKKKGTKHKADSDKSEFEKQISARWMDLTGSEYGFFIEPVYKLDAEKNKIYMSPKSDGIESVQSAVAECIKYTMKSDAESINKFSADHLRGLLLLKKRYSGRFGCLHPKSKESAEFTRMDMLCNDYKDLEVLERQELRYLFNPETGEVLDKKDTRIAVTWFANTTAQVSELELRNRFAIEGKFKTVEINGTQYVTDATHEKNELLEHKRGETPFGGDTYFSIIDPKKVVYFEHEERQDVAKYLSGSLYARYSEENDLAIKN